MLHAVRPLRLCVYIMLKAWYALIAAGIALCLPCEAISDTLVLEGLLDGKMLVKQQASFRIDRAIQELNFRFSLPTKFASRTVSQTFEGLEIAYDPQPASIMDDFDRFGNHFMIATWKNVSRNVSVNMNYRANVKTELPALNSKTPYPIKNLAQDVSVYLKSVDLVRSDHPEIVSMSRKLAQGLTTEYDVVTAIMNYVADNIKYAHNPKSFDVLYTLETKSGNCTNFAHLALALLRAAGIPARMVGGVGLKERWSVPTPQGNLVQGFGQGSHAWIEIYFPDLGWLSYDPQQSKQFTSTRHIKRTHGLDLNTIADSWSAFPYMPDYSGTIDERFVEDVVAVHLKSSEKMPKSYMLSNQVFARLEAEVTEPQLLPEEKPSAVKGETPPAAEDRSQPAPGEVVEFGNMDFPALIDAYRVMDNRGFVVFDTETAEYVTSRYIYAQAFRTGSPVSVSTISLAMRKFGGDGTIYIDVVSDDNGKPGLSGIRSWPIFLENVTKKAGYYWVDFTFPPDVPTALNKGKYWIVLRHSGEAILNWFYTPGKPYGGPHDTRSTSRGYKWDDILNYDFVFKVKAKGL